MKPYLKKLSRKKLLKRSLQNLSYIFFLVRVLLKMLGKTLFEGMALDGGAPMGPNNDTPTLT